MPELVIAFLGDIVGSVGRRAAVYAARVLREQRGAGMVIANGENSRNGSGLSPDNYREIRRGGIDAVTLGDHCYKDRQIIPFIEDAAEPLSRPANLASGAPGKRVIRLGAEQGPPVVVVTVLGRLFMPMVSDNPFAAIDRELGSLAERDAVVIVEVHGEASSEKQAVAWHCLERWTGTEGPRVAAVVGTHTHVQTADARLLDSSVGAMTDVGMCGPHRSVIGRDVRATITAMTTQAPVPLDVASEDARARGALVRVDAASRRPLSIEAVDIACGD